MAVLEDLSNSEMPSTYAQVTTWQGLGRENSVLKPHKPLPRKRDTTISSITSPDLRAQYRSSSNGDLNGGPHSAGNGFHQRSGSSLMHSPTTPVLPPTPPIANHENGDYSHDESSVADTTILRSSVVTPITQQSPPTPDQTPPRLGKTLVIRPWLTTQPSMASTKAESFATAREDFLSDTESEHSAPRWVQSHLRNASHQSIPSPKMPNNSRSVSSPLADVTPRTPQAIWEDDDVWNSLELEQDTEQDNRGPSSEHSCDEEHIKLPDEDLEEPELPSASEQLYIQSYNPQLSNDPEANMEEHRIILNDGTEFDSPTLPQQAFITPESRKTGPSAYYRDIRNSVESSSSFRSRLPRPITNRNHSPATISPKGDVTLRRGPSLRDRLEAVDRSAPSASTEKFADQIGWSESNTDNEHSRPKSWRLSGISTLSTVDAMVFDTEPKRTKTIRRQTKSKSLRTASSPLPNSNRSSILSNPYASLDSPPKHSLSHKKARLSNQNRLSYGSDASRSLSVSSAATPSKTEVIRVAVIPERQSSLQSSAESSRRHSTARSLSLNGRGRFPSLHQNMHTHRLSSDGASIGSCDTCGKHRRYPTVPARASSLSAPTSRNNSKANSRSNSITSQHLRVQQLQAERDLRKTLDRMGSERIAPTVKAITVDAESSAEPSPPEPGTEKWASLRPTSVLDTPFSQPSVLTASGDGASIEMGEARAINLFPHNNESVQLIEKHPLPESRAVRSLRHTVPANDLSNLTDGPPTPRAIAASVPAMDSPLRNPREAPPTPAFQVVPPTPTALGQVDGSQSRSQPATRYNSLRRPPLAAQRYSASFIKSVTRGLSLKNARNPKSDSPELDEHLAPMWRPRRFWSDAEYTEDGSEPYSDNDNGEVRNTLGITQPRSVVSGPVSLLRSLSRGGRPRKQRQGQRSFLYKQSSYGSMARMRTMGKLYRVPGLKGVHFQFVGLGTWSEKLKRARSRKEDERREVRRRMLREAIGPEVVSQGDSRFVDVQRSAEGNARVIY